MNSKLIFSLCIITLASAAITVDTSKHCQCSELNTVDCATQASFCTVSGTSCVDKTFSCTTLNESSCASYGTQCKWNNGTCASGTTSCSDLTTYCSKLSGCATNNSDQCASFTQCSDYSETRCPLSTCSISGKTCTTTPAVVCANLTAANCYGQPSSTTTCLLNNSNVCKEVSITADCSTLTDYKTYCTDACYYDTTSSACRQMTCADVTPQNNTCSGVLTNNSTTYTLCSYNSTSSKCAEATDVATLYTSATCNSSTRQNYKWSTDNKCVACSTLVNKDGSSNAFLLGGLAIIALFA